MSATKRKLVVLLSTVLVALAMATIASPAGAALGVTSFDGGAFASNGDVVTQAGARPDSATTTFELTQVTGGDGRQYSTEDLKNAIVDLPAGLIGDPTGLGTCSETELGGGGETQTAFLDNCPLDSQVGYLAVFTNGAFVPNSNSPTPDLYAGIYNMEAPKGTAALFGFNIVGALYHFSGALIRDDGVPGRYRIKASSLNNPQTVPLSGALVKVWGIPADPDNDVDRGNGLTGIGGGQPAASCGATTNPACTNPSPDAANPRPFFTLPTSCLGPVQTDIAVTGWQGGSGSSSFLSHDNTLPTPNPVGNEGCNVMDFRPTLQARPTTNVADSPTGLDVDLQIPQHETCRTTPQVSCEIATAHLKDTTVTLPEGLVVNPSGANGLDGCSSSEFDLRGNEPVRCPPASKIATVQVETPLLDHFVPGAAYISDPYDNPFDSLLALYIVLDDPQSGTVAKVAGEVRADPLTGQLTTTVSENPQVPFSDFRLNFFEGAGAPLRTPPTCATYTTTSSLTPWSAPDSGGPATPSDPWTITQAPGDLCANKPDKLPHAPTFDAGAISPIAGTHSPFVVHLRREDGSQNFSAVTVTPPQGLVAKLAGTEICPDSALAAAASKRGNEEKANPSCPASSEVGSVVAAAGAGPAPYYAPAKAYISAPYKGAPLSMAVIAPAVAGPFDLGTIVTRIALYVNPKTAEITAVSDPIPSILQGIPLDVRAIHVAMDRPDFTLNPTSCDPMAVGGLLTSTLGQTAQLSSRFQLAECGRLGFKPRMTLSLKGGTRRGKHPALTVNLMPRAGDANIASVSVALPRSEFLENAHIRTICTRPDFATDRCPGGAIYGEASVITSLLDYPLSGHVYLRSSDNLLPDVVPDLRGPSYQPIKLETSGRTDSIRGGIRTTIDFVPDAPFTQAIVALQGGNKGLLVNSRNICDRTYRATVKYTAHNGLTYTANPKMRAGCGRKAKRGKRGKRGANRHGKVARSSAVR